MKVESKLITIDQIHGIIRILFSCNLIFVSVCKPVCEEFLRDASSESKRREKLHFYFLYYLRSCNMYGRKGNGSNTYTDEESCSHKAGTCHITQHYCWTV